MVLGGTTTIRSTWVSIARYCLWQIRHYPYKWPNPICPLDRKQERCATKRRGMGTTTSEEKG